MTLRETVRRFIPVPARRLLQPVRAWLFDIYSVKSYSQEGEDLILRRMFDERRRGFYVDVGAHHPRRFSNTYNFYRCGWSGINVEPNPEAIRLFVKERPRDINLQLGVANRVGELTYYEFDEPALNTFDGELANRRLAETRFRLLRQVGVRVERLQAILQKHVPLNQTIDFLSIDVEGLDLDVLESNDWMKFRPTCVLAEALETSLEQAMLGDIFVFMKAQGYELLGKTFNTLIFRDARTGAPGSVSS